MVEVAAASRTEIWILGPVELRRDGAAVHVGGPRQRALLALLALHANEVVSSERLIQELFGPDAPDTSANALQAAVSRLRRLLEPGALETRGGGYVLHVDPEYLDEARFERLLAEGRAQLAGGAPEAAAVTLNAALALWRGAPLGDLSAPEFAQREARRLDELRLVGLMDRVEAELDLGATQQLVPELEALVAEHPLQERLRGQLMLALYRCGRQAEALAVYRETRRVLRDELGLEPSRALHELERAILRQDAALETKASTEERVVLCPFKGLAPFGASDAAYFFGRERLVDDVVARLVDATFVGLIGSSGSGKSSLLNAGVLPALAGGGLPGSAQWRRIAIRPGAHPLAALPAEADVLAVDQLEEVFTTCRDEEERAAFLVELTRRARTSRIVLVALRADFYGRCAAYPAFAALLSTNHVLLGAMKRDELAHAIEGPAERAGLEVERPLVDALVADVADEPGALPLLSTTLVELWRRREGRLLTFASYRDSGGVRGAVARLAEHAFAQLTEDEQRSARAVMLRLADEEDGAVVRRRVPLDELDVATDKSVARAVAVLTEARLLTVTEGTVEVSHESLLAEWPRLRVWLDEDRAGRRLRAHLATSARDWNGRGRESADLYRGPRLAAALDWSADHGDELNALEREFLDVSRADHERDLAQQRRRNRRLRALLVGVAVLLVLAVAAGGVALVQRHAARHQATIALARQLGAEAVSEPRVDLAMLLARQSVALDDTPETEGTLLATLLRSPAVVSTFNYPFGARPQSLTLSPDGRSLAVTDNNSAVRVYDTRSRRARAFAPNFAFGTPGGYTPDGALLVDTGDNGGTPVMDVRAASDLRLVRRLQWSRVFLHAFRKGSVGGLAPVIVSSDGRFAYTAWDFLRRDQSDGAGWVTRWSLATGRATSVPVGAAGALTMGLTSDDRRVVVVGTARATVLDARTLERLHSVPLPTTPFSHAAAVSPDGRTVALGTILGTVVFVDVHSGAVRSALGAHGAGVSGVAFSPDGRRLVTGAEDGGVIVWDVASGNAENRLLGHASRVLGIAFSRDGQTMYTCSLDGAIFEWDLGTTRRFGALLQAPAVQSYPPDVPSTPPLAVSHDGRFAVRVGTSGVGVYAVQSVRQLSHLELRHGAVTSIAWSPTAPLVAVGGENGVLQLWNLDATPRLVRSLHGLRSINGQPESVEAVAFAPDGKTVVAGDVNHTPDNTPFRYGAVAAWSVATGKLEWLKRNRDGWVCTVAFSPGGSVLAVAQEQGRVRLRDVRSGRVLRTITLYGGSAMNALLADAAAFGRDGTLATGTWAGIVQLWKPFTGVEQGRPTLVAAAPVASIAFDPAKPLFATAGGSDGIVKLWSSTTLRQFGANFPRVSGQWGNAQFTPDGSKLVVIWKDGHAAVWPTDVTSWKAHACRVAGRRLTREEWARFVGSRAYAPAC